MKRYRYDLTHLSYMVGEVGRLMTLSVVPIVAGDSIAASLNGVWRTSPLRRDMVMDPRLDLFAFFVPHRHIYTNWQDFIKEGMKEDETLATDTESTTSLLRCVGYNQVTGTTPRWLTRGYLQIWERYFRVVDDRTNDGVSASTFSSNNTTRRYGYKCARLKSYMSTGRDLDSAIASDGTVDITAGTPDTLSLISLAQSKGEFRTQLKRQWFAARYTDVMREVYGTSVNTDADQRPTLCYRQSQFLSGHDINGTGDTSLGTFSGKIASEVSMAMPRKFFREHGALWFMALVRFPTLWADESHRLVTGSPQPSYKNMAGDPAVLAVEPPEAVLQNFNFDGGNSNSMGTHPAGQFYRCHPSVAHHDFESLQGFPFINTNPDLTGTGTGKTAWYVQPQDYDDVFQTTQLAHWRSQIRVNMIADRVVPTVGSSIFAGSK